MKTQIKTLLASTLTVLAISASLFGTPASAHEKAAASINSPVGIKQVKIIGNVEITLVQREKEGIEYAYGNTGHVSVTQEGNMLKIKSTEMETAKVVVYVNSIYRIDASDYAVVNTADQLQLKYLQVFLSGHATADINLNTESLYTVIKENADLKLAGFTGEHTIVMGKKNKLYTNKLKALETNKDTTEYLVKL